MDNLIKYILLFFFYSAGGWLLESIYCSIGEKRIINRGFLTGPLCPIYGTAALVMTILIYNPFKDRPLIIFLLGIVLCDIVEYITSYVMEKLFNARWWNYSNRKFNINGRVCLETLIPFGIFGSLILLVVNPFVVSIFNKIPDNIFKVITILFFIIFVISPLYAPIMRNIQLSPI